MEAYKAAIAPKYSSYLKTANLTTLPYRKAARALKHALTKGDEIEQYWGLVACCWFGKEARSLTKTIRGLEAEGSGLLRSKAAVYFALHCGENPSDVFDACISGARNEGEWLMVLNDAAFLVEARPDLGVRIKPCEGVDDTYARERLKFINGL